MGADVPESLDGAGGPGEAHPQVGNRLANGVEDPLGGRLHAARRAAELDRLPGDHRGGELPPVHGVGVHDPAHDLGVRAHVGGGDVPVRPEEVDHLGEVAPGEPLQLPRESFAGSQTTPPFPPPKGTFTAAHL